MITKKSNQTSKLRINPIFGDLGMIVQFIRSKMIRQIYSGDKKVWWTIFLWLMQAKVEMLAVLSRSILRYNHGRHTTGILMSIWALSMLIAFNFGQGYGYAISFIPFGAPILLINMSWSQFEGVVWYETTSQSIAIWAIIFTVFQLIHVGRIYAEIGNVDDHMRRGTSWLSQGIFKNKYLSEFHIQCFIEPLLVAGIGYGVWHFNDDLPFLIIACSSAICLFFQEFLDGSYRYYHSRF